MESTEKHKVVIVGCGGMSNYWLDILKDRNNVEVVGLVDIMKDRAAEQAAKYELSDVVCSTDTAQALKASGAEIVFDLTIPAAHHETAMTAFQHGCHLLAEKPMAASLAEARDTLEASRKANRLYAVMQNRRYDLNIRRFHQFLASGEIGGLSSLHADFFTGPRFDGFRKEMDHVLLLDMAIHHFDAARYVMDADPVSVICQEWNEGAWFRHGSSVMACFEMSNGLIYTYRGSWAADGNETTWECAWRALCTDGSVLWDGANNFDAQKTLEAGQFGTKTEQRSIPEEPDDNRDGGHSGCIDDFLRCVHEGGTPETSAEDNIKSLAMVFGAIKSAETGSRVFISDILN
jgi:predicted dehydrogenase